MHPKEASSEETPYGRYITSEGWFIHNLGEALAVRNEEKGGALYPLEARESPFPDFGVNVRVLWPGEPNALYHSEVCRKGSSYFRAHPLTPSREGGSCADGSRVTCGSRSASSATSSATITVAPSNSSTEKVSVETCLRFSVRETAMNSLTSSSVGGLPQTSSRLSAVLLRRSSTRVAASRTCIPVSGSHPNAITRS